MAMVSEILSPARLVPKQSAICSNILTMKAFETISALPEVHWGMPSSGEGKLWGLTPSHNCFQVRGNRKLVNF
jgi:hypothetical protein